jgi:hypothetical protein
MEYEQFDFIECDLFSLYYTFDLEYITAEYGYIILSF